MPTVFGDELIHWDASRSLAEGDGLRVRDGGYGFGPVYPALLAPVHAAGPRRPLRVSVGALLERRPLLVGGDPRVPARPAPRCPGAGASRAPRSPSSLPSALYTGFVMTEGAAYAACTLAMLRDLSACLERPTADAQFLALAALVLAAGVRLQLAALGVAFAAALVVRSLVSRGARLPPRARPRTPVAAAPRARRRRGRARRQRRARQPARGLRRPLALVRRRRGRAVDVALPRRTGPLPRARAARRRAGDAGRPRSRRAPGKPPGRCVRLTLRVA